MDRAPVAVTTGPTSLSQVLRRLADHSVKGNDRRTLPEMLLTAGSNCPSVVAGWPCEL